MRYVHWVIVTVNNNMIYMIPEHPMIPISKKFEDPEKFARMPLILDVNIPWGTGKRSIS